MTLPRAVLLLLCSLSAVGVGCGNDYSAEHCDDIIRQIQTSLEDNVNKGILVREAIACGEDGVANRADSFDARASDGDVEYLQSAFRNACDEYQDHC
jgi:hypothetical protein